MALPLIHRIAATGLPTHIGVTGVHQGTLVAYLKPLTFPTYLAANELIAAELGRFLGLPIPAGGVAWSGVKGAPPFFASVSFNLSGADLPPIDVDTLVKKKPDLAAGIVVFDALIANLDRHAKNLSYSPKDDALHVFDHSHALFGPLPAEGISRLGIMKNKLCLNLDKQTDPRYTRHCLGDSIKDATQLLPWLLKVKEMPTSWLGRVVTTQGVALSNEEAICVLDFLEYRRDNLREIFQANQHQFPSLNQKSLL